MSGKEARSLVQRLLQKFSQEIPKPDLGLGIKLKHPQDSRTNRDELCM